ncbi:hypothetical protein [Spiroplasma alleghenense]|uniref:Uncharacterized protein n=1 Tax=Spiroplasma alleghenense TaxID=216931 RepID=A0A345Z2U4_9MOLU|nr:hypothetical protein [Spiroplasma alleghenense]AXK50923.1 hypothetical protein SALLE_v1c02470 [Spiroplasma alleghenense]
MIDHLEAIQWDCETRKFLVSQNFKVDSRLKSFIENNILTIPTTQDIVNELYPYIDLKIKEELIAKSIERESCVKKILQNSIAKKTKLIPFLLDECDDKFHQQIAKRIITEFNQIIYKYGVSKIQTNVIKIIWKENPVIGQIPFVLETNNGVIIVDIRTGQTNFEDRSKGLLFLYEKLWSQNSSSKVLKKILINPRWDIAVQEVENPNKNEIWKLLNF